MTGAARDGGGPRMREHAWPEASATPGGGPVLARPGRQAPHVAGVRGWRGRAAFRWTRTPRLRCARMAGHVSELPALLERME